MQAATPRWFPFLLATALSIACRSNQQMLVDGDVLKTPVCLECYEAVSEVLRTHPTAGGRKDEVLETYTCPRCRTQMSVYIESGIHMVQCGGCATEGIPWNQCRPADTSRQGRDATPHGT